MKTHLCHISCDDVVGEFGVETGVAIVWSKDWMRGVISPLSSP